MKKIVLCILVSLLFISVAYADSGDNPRKWSQLPDWQFGFDIGSNNSGNVVADDFLCVNGMPVTDVHWWGSYESDMIPGQPGQINPIPTSFLISFWSDIPAGPSPFSRPGQLLKSYSFPGLLGQWSGYQVWAQHNGYQFYADISHDPFYQMQGNIYWVSIMSLDNPLWGWKTSADHWNDDAVQGDPLSGALQELRYPSNHPFAGSSIDMAYELTTTPEPLSALLFLMGGGFLAWSKKR